MWTFSKINTAINVLEYLNKDNTFECSLYKFLYKYLEGGIEIARLDKKWELDQHLGTKIQIIK